MDDKFEKKLFQMAEKERIKVPEAFKDRIENNLAQIPPERRRYKMNCRKAVILAAALVMLFSITATASVGILRERMEAMNREKLKEYFVQIYTKKIPVDNYNRYFSDSERQRMEQLKEKYEGEGRFPEGELTLIDRPEQYKGKNVSYYPEAGTFFLPEKEMSDEELLQIIDFRSKRDYSLQKMNELIAAGEETMPDEALQRKEPDELTELSLLDSDAVWEPDQELIIAYTGDLSVTAMAAGEKYIYLGGWNSVHRMEIGSGGSEVFFDGMEKETVVTGMYVDQAENVYVVGAKMDLERKIVVDDEYAFPASTSVIWKLDSDGNVLSEISLSEYEEKYGSWSNRMTVDSNGYLYLRGIKENAEKILVLDESGRQVSVISSGDYQFHGQGGLNVGKDGKVYTVVFTRRSKSDKREMGIASVNVEEGKLEDVYMGIMPEGTIMIEVLAPGADTDFVFWGDNGIFTYNLGDPEAVCMMPAYEMPCELEGAKYCALPDGRIVLATSTEYVDETYGGEFKRTLWKPGSAYFYYLPGRWQ